MLQDYKAIEVSRAAAARLDKDMRSWKTLYTTTKTMTDSKANLERLSSMLAHELNNPHGPRAQMVTRLHMRINAMRQRLEYASIIRYATR